MNIILIQPADKEPAEAIDYYNDQLEGLGVQFYTSFLDTVGYIAQTPDTCDPVRNFSWHFRADALHSSKISVKVRK